MAKKKDKKGKDVTIQAPAVQIKIAIK